VSDAPTEDLPLPSRSKRRNGSSSANPPGTARSVRLFGSRMFFRLWLAQLSSSLGDWIGFVAITALSNRLAGTNGVALVLSARLVPGFFFGSVGGVIVDRLDRKKVMVACDIGRGIFVGLLPFVHHLWLLFAVNLVLEGLTLLWTPAKEATVPNLVPADQLPRANSLGLGAAYGTFPLGAAMFTALAGLATYLSRFEPLRMLRVNQENLAIWTDTLTFLVSAALISSLALPARARSRADGEKHRIDIGAHVREVREGWRFIGHSRVVRAVMIALSCGLVGGGMVVPLGPVVAKDVLGGGPKSFGALITALGVGVALGVIGISAVQRRVSPERTFVRAALLAGASLFAAASMWALTPALLLVALMGIGAGAVYVLGFALIQVNTEDELRGRTFAALYAIVRFCLLLSFVMGPLMASLFGNLARRALGGKVELGPWTVHLSGGRIALWVAALIIMGAGLLARGSLRRPAAVDAPAAADAPDTSE
jgi:dTMP kinase